MCETNDDLKLFRQAFVEAMHENTMMILAEYPEKPIFSKKHMRAMKRILSGQKKTPIKRSGRVSPRKRLIAALIAAALLLGGLTVYAKRKAVIELIEQIYEKYTRIIYHKDQDDGADLTDGIEEERIPAYVPEGFVLRDYQSSLSDVYVEWQNEDEFIIFSQNTIGTVYDLDNEHSDIFTIVIGSYTVYEHQNEYINTYIWNDGEYSYLLRCPSTLMFDDVSNMILSVSAIK